jgi:hypothetical protein
MVKYIMKSVKPGHVQVGDIIAHISWGARLLRIEATKISKGVADVIYSYEYTFFATTDPNIPLTDREKRAAPRSVNWSGQDNTLKRVCGVVR